VFGELGRERRRAAIACHLSRIVQQDGDLGVRRVTGKREVTRAQDRIVDDRRDARVNRPALVAQVAVEGRRQQRMRETDDAVLPLDHVCSRRRAEHVCGDARADQEGFRRGAERRRKRERVARGSGKLCEPRAKELVERLGNRERRERIDRRIDNARQLEREEGIAAGVLVYAQQRLAPEGSAEAVGEEPVKSTDAERPHR
jgi:hypothetical protein